LSEYTVNIKVVASSEDAAIQQVTQKLSEAKEKIQETGQAAEESGFGISELKEKVLALAEAFGVMIGAREVISFFKEMISAGMDEEHQLIQVADAERRMAGATNEQVEHGKEWLDTLAKISGITKDQLIPSYIQALGVTKDMGTAQAILQVAAGVAAHGYGDLASSVDKMTRFMMTGMIRGSDPLTASIIAGKNAGEDFDTILRTRLIPAFGDAGAKMNDLKMQAERQKVAWEESKEQMGQMWQGIVTMGLPVLRGLIEMLGFAVGGVAMVGTAAKLGFGEFMASLNAAYVFAKTHSLAEAQSAFNEQTKKLTDEASKSMDGIVAHLDEIVKLADTGLGKLTPEQIKAQKAAKDAAAGYALLEAAIKQTAKTEESYKSQMLALYRAEAKDARLPEEARAEARVKLMDALRASNSKMAAEEKAQAAKNAATILADQKKMQEAMKAGEEKYWQQHLNMVKQRLEDEKKLRDKAAKDSLKVVETVIRTEQALQFKHSKDFKKMNADQLRDYIRDLNEGLIVFAQNEAKKKQIEMDLADAQILLAKLVARQKHMEELGAAQDAISTAESIFGQSKALGYAMAIVNAMQAYNLQLSQGDPYTAWFRAAAALASGMAQAKAINSVTLGGGGDISSTASPKMTMPAGYGAPPSTTPAPVYHSTTNQTGGNINVNVQTLISADGDRAVQNLAYQVAKQMPVVNRRVSRAPAVQAGKRGH
jgi:CRISPR/Cas system CSM-associated protein Csm2 small subunit/translation elongation factor EF-1beta